MSHLRHGCCEDDAAELGSGNQVGRYVRNDRREHPCDSPQDQRIGEQLELVDVVVAASPAGKDVVTARQGPLDDRLPQPLELRNLSELGFLR